MNVKEKRQLSSAFVFFSKFQWTWNKSGQQLSSTFISAQCRDTNWPHISSDLWRSPKCFIVENFLTQATGTQNSLNCLLSFSSSFQKWLPTTCISELRKNHSQEKSCHKLSVTLIFIPPSQGVASYPGEIAAAEKERHLLWFTPSCKKDMQLSSAISYHTPPKFTVSGMI